MTIACLKTISIKNFRCFKSVNFDLDAEIILLQGPNGSGKTSLLEALHYGSNLRSFRTRIPKELIKFGTDCFFIRISSPTQEMSVGVAGSKRQVKLNQKPVTSFCQLRTFHTVMTVTEDDLMLIKGSPEERRLFLDNLLVLLDPALADLFKEYRIVVNNRNALLFKGFYAFDELVVWTKKLWELSKVIQTKRTELIKDLSLSSKEFITSYFDDLYEIHYEYSSKYVLENLLWEEFLVFWKTTIFNQECRFKRTLFGSHTDDLLLSFNSKSARFYASRGQQKLMLMLIKMAQVTLLRKLISEDEGITFLIDDFMTDFDEQIMKKIISAGKSLKIQLIFTSPVKKGLDETLLVSYGARVIDISI